MEARAQRPLREHLATEEKPFHFTDSGLTNVYLVGIKYFEHEDGSIVAEIPAIKQLMRLIASDILYSSTLLTGKEIRFLRKRLGMKAVDFAQLVRMEAETLSRIENEKQPVSDQVDALVRLCYLLSCGDPALSEEAARLMQRLQEETDKGHQRKIVMKITEGTEWTDLPAAA